ncbi:hypothetical protein AYJ66_17370 [Dietzia cinnamea]|nr:hypothetical protein AYJ66_17370 [Dietzia cinnamea]
MSIRCFAAKRVNIIKISVDEALGDCRYVFPKFIGCFYQLVIDIGEIRNISDIIPAELKITANRVKYDGRAGISNVDIIIDGRTANIHFHFSLF